MKALAITLAGLVCAHASGAMACSRFAIPLGLANPSSAAAAMVAKSESVVRARITGFSKNSEVSTRYVRERSAQNGLTPGEIESIQYLRTGARESIGADRPENYYARIHFRVIEQIKGKSQTTFFLDGEEIRPPRLAVQIEYWFRELWRPKAERDMSFPYGFKGPVYNFGYQDSRDWNGDSCTTFVSGGRGDEYLIMRQADGKLTSTTVEAVFQNLDRGVGRYTGTAEAPSFQFVGNSHPWLRLVRSAAQAERRRVN